MDIRISQLAEQKIREAAELNNTEPVVRIYVTEVSCRGAKFGIAFNDPGSNDEIIDLNNIRYAIDREYMPSHADGLDIDYVIGEREGFIIKSLRPVNKNCGGGCGHKNCCSKCNC